MKRCCYEIYVKDAQLVVMLTVETTRLKKVITTSKTTEWYIPLHYIRGALLGKKQLVSTSNIEEKKEYPFLEKLKFWK